MSLIKQALYPIYGVKSNNYLKEMMEYQYVMPLEGGSVMVSGRNREYVEKIEHEIFQFVVSYTFLVQIRQKNYCVTF